MTAYEIDLMTRLRDAALRIITPALRASDPGAVQAINDASNLLVNPDADQDGAKPVFGYAATIAGVLTHCMVDERRRVWKFDTATRKYVLL